MNKKKALNKSQTDNGPTETVVLQKSNQSLVFISHDTRDADLAEEFSTLLKSASAGGLKSFRSSDKKGTQGIEFGQEWYPAIMEKIDEASEVVCLLTKRSVERPWILYEAGVAKGKLGKNVIGIAMGIHSSFAFTGPFAQFQNNDGTPDSIKKLVLDLVCKVPGLDPDPSLVGTLVDAFHRRANEIIEKTDKQPAKNEKPTSEDLVAKLFEEVKIMFETLPSKIENRIEPEYRRKRRRFHPMMFEEFAHFGGSKENPYISFLIMISLYKDDLPWFYEIGLETYRNLKTAKAQPDREKIIVNFRKSLDMLDHPMMREFYDDSKENYMLFRESRHMFKHMLDRLLHEKK
jgi:hypothetical protein